MTQNRPFRRLAFAALATLSVFLAALAVAGLASAADGSGELPETFTLAPRNGGDRGEWQVIYPAPDVAISSGGSSGSGGKMEVSSSTSQKGPDTYNTTFEWLPEEAWRDGEGRWHAVHGLLTVSPDYGSTTTVNDRTVFTPSWEVDWRETATGLSLGTTGLAGGGAAASAGIFGGEESTSTLVLTTWRTAPVCGLGDALRAGVELTEPIAADGCSDGTLVFKATGVEVLDGAPAVRFEAHDEQTSYSYWYNPGIPEPLRVLQSTQDGPASDLRLVSFQRGDSPWNTGLTLPADEELPEIAVAARQPWGPDDSQVEHPFPLSSAWQMAASDLAYRDFSAFLADHPEAAAVMASYGDQGHGSTTERTWSVVVLADDGSTFYLVATQTERFAGGDATDMLGVPPAGPPLYTYSFTTGNSAVSGVTLADLPDEMPTVASALAYWQALVGSKEPGNAWRVTMCGCEGGLQLQAGRDLFHRFAKPATGAAPEPTIVSSLLMLDPAGRPAGLMEANVTYTRTAGLLASGSQAGVEGALQVGLASSPAAPIALSAVAMPTTVGASFLALLAGLAVWFWPAVKGTPLMGLFSRVREDRVLDHPVRAEIVQRVEAQPGIHYQELLRLVGGGKGALEHHLRKLEAARQVRPVRGPYYTCYFPWGTGAAERAAAPALKSDGARRVLAAVRSEPGLTGQELAARTGLSPSSVSDHVARLAAAGLVQSSRAGRVVRVQPAGASSAA